MGRGLAATPAPRRCPPEPFPGCAGPPAASQPLPVTPPAPPCWAPRRVMRVLSWPHLTLHFCKRSAKPCPLEKCSSIPPPTPKTSPPLGPGCPLPKPSFCQGGKGRREGADPWRCPQQPHGVSEALGGQEHPYGGPGRAARLPAVPIAAALPAQHSSRGGCSPRGPGARRPREGCSRSCAWL